MADFECTCFVVKGERAAAWGEDCWCWYPKPNYNERIVRCKDCKFCLEKCKYFNGSPVCVRCGSEIDGFDAFETEPDGFCKWGEPRED